MASILLLCSIAAATASPEVALPMGVARGIEVPGGVERFGGIPYAVPVVKERRFTRSEVATEKWEGGELDCTGFGAPCIQNPAGDPNETPDPEAPPPNEDCLNLNIWRPKTPAPTVALPVMVWILGGGLCSGSAADRSFNGTNYASNGTIIVTLNYRLGALGYLVTDGLHQDGSSGGMNGINDQITGLQWVQKYISYFGGDPSRVTLFGQSSGGYSVCTISVSPRAAGTFQKAILHSGPCLGGPAHKGWGPMNTTFGLTVTKQIMASVNVTTIAELMNVPAEAVQWPRYTMWNLTVAPYFSGYFTDTYVIPGDGLPETQWAAGNINPASLMIGSTSKDGTAAFYGTAPTLGLVPPDAKQTTEADYEECMKDAWEGQAGAVLEQYPMVAYGSPQSAFCQADAEAYVVCPSYTVADYAHAAGRDVWRFEFAHFQPNYLKPDGFGCDSGVELDVTHPTVTPQERGWATHGSDIRYIFGTTVGPDSLGPPYNLTHCPFTASEADLSRTIRSYWAAYARYGSPTSSAVWPQYTPAERLTLRFSTEDIDGSPTGVYKNLHDSNCKFWRNF